MSDLQHSQDRRSATGSESAAERSRSTASSMVAALISAAAIAAVVLAIGPILTSLADTHLSRAGWFAMSFGILVTLILGIGLMALVFISNRRGYDDLGHRR
jgi:hypothetical protein